MKNRPEVQTPLPDRSKAKALYEKQLPGHKATLLKLVQEVRQVLEPHGLAPAIKFRIKSFDAYFDKLRKLKSSAGNNRASTITDFFGLRIICPFLEDIETVERLIAAQYEVVATEYKADQHSFREFGYDSVHLTVRLGNMLSGRLVPGVRKVCEVQLRTILQDAWAEVEHELVYKSDITLPNQSIRRKLASLNATLTLSDLIFQEIRDYQKALRKHGRNRRASLEYNLDSIQLLAMAQSVATEMDSPAGSVPIPSIMTSRLEKVMLRALEAHSNQDLEGAIERYGQLLGMRLDRKIRSLVYNHRGMAYFASGELHKALGDFAKAISYDQDCDRGYINRGRCYRKIKKYDRALEDFSRALKLNPSLADSYFGRALVYYDMKQFARAKVDCEKALGIQADYQPARELIKTIHQEIL